MNKFAFGLLASTSLSCVTGPVLADTIFESVSGFGASSSAPTLVETGETLFVGDTDQTTPAWFEVVAQGTAQYVRIEFTYGSFEGVSLPLAQGTPGIVAGPASGPPITTPAGGFEGVSNPSASAPALNLLAPGTGSPEGEGSSALLPFATVTAPAFSSSSSAGAEGGSSGESFTIDLLLQPGEALPFSFTYDFDYALEVATSDVPEPATAALLGVGLMGVGAVRRRRRGIR